MVDSCQHCKPCLRGLEQYCDEGSTYTYNANDRRDAMPTYGGYSDTIVVTEKFVLKVPDGLDLKAAAPLLCAGITTWSPLRHWNVGPEQQGRGGGPRRPRPHGAEARQGAGRRRHPVHPLPRQGSRRPPPGRRPASCSPPTPAQMATVNGQFDLIIDTVPTTTTSTPTCRRWRWTATLVLVGYLGPLEPVLIPCRCHGAQVGRRLADRRHRGDAGDARFLRQARHRLGRRDDRRSRTSTRPTSACCKSDVKYRFVIDMASLKA